MTPRALAAKRMISVVCCCAFFSSGSADAAPTLYTRDGPWLASLSQSNGAFQFVGSNSQNESVDAISSRASEPDILYGVENQDFPNPGAKLVRINRHTGFQSDGPIFVESALGFAKPYATGLAISPANPAVAVLIGVDLGHPLLFPASPSPTAGQYFIWTVDVATGTVLSPGVPTQELRQLAFNLDGSKLYSTTENEGRLVTIDPSTGDVTLIGDPGLSPYIDGLAFHPVDGRLFAIDGFDSDDLVTLDPITGAFIEKIGDIGLGGPSGLAFNLPEPSVSLLAIAISLTFLGIRRR